MCRGIACDGTSPGGFRLSASVIRTRWCGLAWLPKVGAGCGKSARPVLCGGRRATVVPTATDRCSVFRRPTFASAARQARSRCLAASGEREGAGTRYTDLENALAHFNKRLGPTQVSPADRVRNRNCRMLFDGSITR